MHRASRFGHVSDYVDRAAGGLFLIVQTETASATAQVEEIAAVPGVDAVFFGPDDLFTGMGKLGQPGDNAVTGEIERTVKKVKSAGKAAGVLAPDPDLAAHYLDSGFDFVSAATDCGILFGQVRRVSGQFRRSGVTA